MDSTTVYKRKTGKLVAKNLIILVVLVAVAALSIWAWFTSGSSAEADGINVKAKADGIEVSWDGINYYQNLTALSDADVVEGETGLALNITGEAGVPSPLKLVTGNGTKFFEPYLNRRKGEVLTNTDGSWQGYNITEGTGKYIDIPLYFKSTTARDIYLAGDSKVSPKSTTKRISDYGPFSKDYICAASRVAFLDSTMQNCSFIWAPNADYELRESEAGYTRFETTVTEEITVSGGGTTGIDGGVEDDGKTYYFWTFYDDAVVTAYPNDLSQFESSKFVYSSDVRYFVTEVTTYIPTYGGDNPSIPIFINESSSRPSAYSNNYNTYIEGASSKNLVKSSDGQYFGVTNTNFNIGNATCSNAMYIINGNIKAGAKITYELGYDPVNKLLVILSYQVEGGGSFSLGEEGGDITTTVTYYPLENGKNCTLVNPGNAIAISSGEHYKKAVQFRDDSTKLNVLPLSIALSEQFTVEKTGDGYKATYKFKNVKTNTYLTVTGGSVTLSSNGSSFSLDYIEGFNGPALKSGEYYVVFNNGNLNAVKSSELDNNDIVTVYTGSSYELFTNITADSQSYQYYDSDEGLVSLNANSTPKLFTSTNSTSATTTIGNTKIVTLTKANETDEYYTAQIVMRIWAEGTDRDAKTPLADGIFDTSFHFISK